MLIKRQFFNPDACCWEVRKREMDVTNLELNKFFVTAPEEARKCIPRATDSDVLFLINGSVISPEGIV
jgi:hypothetical protein